MKTQARPKHTHEGVAALNLPFLEVADVCGRHLESTRGRELGMTVAAAINALGRLAQYPADAIDSDLIGHKSLSIQTTAISDTTIVYCPIDISSSGIDSVNLPIRLS